MRSGRFFNGKENAMPFVDFQEIKKRISIEDAVKVLGLKMKPGNNQLRGPCPRCNEGGDRALVITPSKSAYFCFAEKKGGDQIALAAHIRACSVRDAAVFLSGEESTGTSISTSTSGSTVPKSEGGERSDRTLQPLSYLESDHEAVSAVGFDPEFCRHHGIGYAGRGIMRGTVAVPFRDEHGTLLGYIGITEAKLPADFTPNVVTFKRSA
jgi:DNA primase